MCKKNRSLYIECKSLINPQVKGHTNQTVCGHFLRLKCTSIIPVVLGGGLTQLMGKLTFQENPKAVTMLAVTRFELKICHAETVQQKKEHGTQTLTLLKIAVCSSTCIMTN